MENPLLKSYNKIFKWFITVTMIIIVITRLAITQPLVDNLQGESNKQNIERIYSSLSTRIRLVDLVVEDNAVWRELVMNLDNKEFLKNSFNSDLLDTYDLEYLGVYNLQNELEYKIYSNEANEALKQTVKEKQNVIKSLGLAVERKKSYQGIREVEGEYYYFSIHLIQNSEEDENYYGYLVIIKKIDSVFIAKFALETGYKLRILESNEYSKYVESGNLEKAFKNYDVHYIRAKDRNRYFLPFFGSKNKPVFILELIIENDFRKYYKLSYIRIAAILIAFLITIFLLKFFIKEKVISPILELSEKMDNYLTENKDYIMPKTGRNNEIDKLINSYNEMIEMLSLREKELKKANFKLKKSVYVDHLTQVATRKIIEDKLDHLFESAKKSSKSIAIVMMDIDFFKQYNDTYGHQRGDDVLKSIGSLLKRHFVGKGSIIVRYGGEEFLIYMMQEKDEKKVLEVLEGIMDELKEMDIEHMGSELRRLTVSCGVYLDIPKEQDTIDQTIKCADEKLYRAKAEGRNKIII